MTFIKLGIRLSAVLYVHRSIVFLSLEVNTTIPEWRGRWENDEGRATDARKGRWYGKYVLVWFEEEMKWNGTSLIILFSYEEVMFNLNVNIFFCCLYFYKLFIYN